jgi:hypothetical protein
MAAAPAPLSPPLYLTFSSSSEWWQPIGEYAHVPDRGRFL